MKYGNKQQYAVTVTSYVGKQSDVQGGASDGKAKNGDGLIRRLLQLDGNPFTPANGPVEVGDARSSRRPCTAPRGSPFLSHIPSAAPG